MGCCNLYPHKMKDLGVPKGSLSYHYLMLSLIVCSPLSSHLATTISLYRVIWVPLKVLHLNMPLPLFLSLNEANGYVVKLCLLLSHRAIFCRPIFFSTTVMLLNIFCMFSMLIHSDVLIFRNYGMILCILNGAPFFVYVQPPNTLDFTLKTLLFSLSMKLPIRWTMIFLWLKHIIRDSYRQFYLAKATRRRQDCSGQTTLVDIVNTRAYYLSLNNPLHQTLIRYVLTGS